MKASKNIIKLHKNASTGVDSLTVPTDLKGDIPSGSIFHPFLETAENKIRIVYELMTISPAAISAKIPGPRPTASP